MTANQPPRRRYRVRFFFIPVGLIVFGTVYLVRACDSGATVTGDFLDPGTLARAVEQGAQRNGDGTPYFAACAQTVFPDYVCTVDFYGGTMATYNVTVATNGSSWYAEP